MSTNKTISDQVNAFLALFISKTEAQGERPDIEEIDHWRLGKLKGKRAEEIKYFIANDPEIYQQWQQLRTEAKTSEHTIKANSYTSLLVQWLYTFTQPKAYAPVVLTAFIGYFLISLNLQQSDDMLYLAQQDIQAWQQKTQQDKSYQLGMSRGWKVTPQSTKNTDDNLKNYQLGLNQFLKNPIKVDVSSMHLCALDDDACINKKQFFTVLGQWASKANVICQQANKDDKNKIKLRLNDWSKAPLIATQIDMKNLFKTWDNDPSIKDSCKKIKQMVTLGVKA